MSSHEFALGHDHAVGEISSHQILVDARRHVGQILVAADAAGLVGRCHGRDEIGEEKNTPILYLQYFRFVYVRSS